MNRNLPVLGAFAAAALFAGAANADVVLNTSLGPVTPPGVTTTDATGTRSTNASSVRVNEAPAANDWLQRDLGDGATIGITTDYARSGNGSVYFNLPNGASKASLEYFFSAPQSLASFGGASYDWYRDGVSLDANGADKFAPALRLYVNNGVTSGTLIFEPTYQSNAPLPENSWQTSLINNSSIVWARPAFPHDPGASCDTDACFDSLGDFRSFNANSNFVVSGFSLGMGSGNGGFTGAADNVSFTFGNQTSTFNFEVAAAVPEPATWAMMLLGFGGLGALLRRARRNGALAAA